MEIDDVAPCRFANPPLTQMQASQKPHAAIWEAARVFHDGQVASACLIDLSTEKAMIRTVLQLSPGTEVTIGVHLAGPLAEIAGMDHLRLDLTVFDLAYRGNPDHFGSYYYYCLHEPIRGSESFRRAAAVIVAAFERDAA